MATNTNPKGTAMNTNTETRRFEWPAHRVPGSTWQTDFRKQNVEPGYIDYKAFTAAHRNSYGVAYLYASLDLAEVESRVVIVDEKMISSYTDPIEVHEVTVAERFFVIDGMGRPVGGVHHGSQTFRTEAEAEKALAKWKKAHAKWWAERAQLEALKDAVSALPTMTCPAGIDPAHADTKVGDKVLIQGHGYLRAGLVIEATPARLKVAYTTRAARNEGGIPYAKWIKRPTRVVAA